MAYFDFENEPTDITLDEVKQVIPYYRNTPNYNELAALIDTWHNDLVNEGNSYQLACHICLEKLANQILSTSN